LVAEALLDEYGKQGEFIAYDIVKERRCAAVPAGGVTISEFMGGNEYSPGTRNMFTAGLEVETISTSLTEDVFRVHHCEWARYFREKHPRVGYLMACSTDEAFARASNPALRLQRTSTLMEGGDFCDFRYYAVEEDPS
ncbi:MAG: L-2-amino-thiazoline-4-carboxylic acid hydrolase, partial [Anaerolineae bacterium]